MTDKIEGYLEVGHNGQGEVVLNLDKDRNGVGHIVFSSNQARMLAKSLTKQARVAEKEHERAKKVAHAFYMESLSRP